MENLDFFITSNTQPRGVSSRRKESSSKFQRDLLLKKFSKKLLVNQSLGRSLVSFQSNKTAPFYKWFKYREGFSAELIHYILKKISRTGGVLLDPFAGAGTTLFEGGASGWAPIGIELLPVGILAMKARQASKIDVDLLRKSINSILKEDFSKYYNEKFSFKHIPITQGAFPPATEIQLAGYLALINKKYKKPPELFAILDFASFSILEDISFTRKDGQYLRWDHRAGKSNGKSTFYKGELLPFKKAISEKLGQILSDLENSKTILQSNLFEEENLSHNLEHQDLKVYQGSCLKILPTLPSGTIDLVITSPPYCNRYDYTRTYALELAYLGIGNDALKDLRQALLSCTVENKEKISELESFYESIAQSSTFYEVTKVFDNQLALQEVLTLLDSYAKSDQLNNPNIARMVRNYFFEMCFTIKEMSRLLTQDGKVVMVNDNVQYAGEEVPVDLILSDFAESFGLTCEVIWVLPRGKGNSSQQMGAHGRSELRKCTYVWRRA